MAGTSALGPDAAAVRLHQPLADGQAQAEARAVAAGEVGMLPEEVRQLVRRYAPAPVRHRDLLVLAPELPPAFSARKKAPRGTLEETLTAKRLGLTGALARTLRTTNIIENLMVER